MRYVSAFKEVMQSTVKTVSFLSLVWEGLSLVSFSESKPLE